MESPVSQPGEGKDLLRDTPVRLLGYANEVGESFRPLVPLWAVRASYGVAVGYVLVDTWDKIRRERANPVATRADVLYRGFDNLVWQLLASVAVPGLTINRVVWAAGHAVRAGRFAPGVLRWVPTAIGLAAIPAIFGPIDRLVDSGMDRSVRRLWARGRDTMHAAFPSLSAPVSRR